MRTTHKEARPGRMFSTFVHCSAFAEASNRLYINILSMIFLWSIDSRCIAFGCSLNIRHIAKCCLPHLNNKSTLNHHFIFACRVHVLLTLRRKPGFRYNFITLCRVREVCFWWWNLVYFFLKIYIKLCHLFHVDSTTHIFFYISLVAFLGVYARSFFNLFYCVLLLRSGNFWDRLYILPKKCYEMFPDFKPVFLEMRFLKFHLQMPMSHRTSDLIG